MGKHKRKSKTANYRPALSTVKSEQAKHVLENVMVRCPNCDQPIRPSVMDYLPRPATFKQYRCENCNVWLTIDFRSRIKLIVMGTIGLLLLCMGFAKLLIVVGGSLNDPNHAGPLIFFVLLGMGGQYALARYMRRIAKWVVVED